MRGTGAIRAPPVSSLAVGLSSCLLYVNVANAIVTQETHSREPYSGRVDEQETMLSGVGVGLVGLVLATVISGGRAAPLECRPQGPILPRPNLSKSRTFQDAARQLTGILDAAAGDNEGKITIRAGWDVNSTTLSIGIISHDQPGGPGVPLWEYHHLAINTFLGSKRLNRDSQYQIGSVSKAITDAIVVRSGLNLDDPITKYITGLGGRPSLIQWDTVTLRGLASHLAGIPPNCAYRWKSPALPLAAPTDRACRRILRVLSSQVILRVPRLSADLPERLSHV